MTDMNFSSFNKNRHVLACLCCLFMNLFGLLITRTMLLEGFCSEFEFNLRRKKIVAHDEFHISCLMNNKCFHLKVQEGALFVTDSQASPYLGRSKPFPVVIN